MHRYMSRDHLRTSEESLLQKVGLPSYDNANDHTKQPQSAAKDLYNKNLDEQGRILCI